MTLPLWSPFALLAAVCVVYPRPTWTRRVDWFVAASWTVLLLFCLAVWAGVGLFMWWVW